MTTYNPLHIFLLYRLIPLLCTLHHLFCRRLLGPNMTFFNRKDMSLELVLEV